MEKKYKREHCPNPFYRVKKNLKTGQSQIVMVGSCNDFLFCKLCADKKRRRSFFKILKKTRELEAHKKMGEEFFHLTLTMSLNGDSLEEGFKRFKGNLDKLKRTISWKRSVNGYIGGIEVSAKAIHVHIMISAKNLDFDSLRYSWWKYTDCDQVDLRKVGKSNCDIKKVISYLVKGIDDDYKEEFSKLREKKKIRLMVTSIRKPSFLDNIAITRHTDFVTYNYYGLYKSKEDALKALEWSNDNPD